MSWPSVEIDPILNFDKSNLNLLSYSNASFPDSNILLFCYRVMYDFTNSTGAEEDFWTEMESDIQNFSVVTTSDEQQTMVVVDVVQEQNQL